MELNTCLVFAYSLYVWDVMMNWILLHLQAVACVLLPQRMFIVKWGPVPLPVVIVFSLPALPRWKSRDILYICIPQLPTVLTVAIWVKTNPSRELLR